MTTETTKTEQVTLPSDVIDFISQAVLLATNHGGWFDRRGFETLGPLFDKGNALIHKYMPQEEQP